MVSSTWKIPLLLANARLYELATTPPNSPAQSGEKKKYGVAPDFMSRPFIRKVALLTRALTWGLTIAECSVILANSHTTSPARRILSFLVRGERTASGVRLTRSWLLGWALLCSGSFIRLACYRALGHLFTWELSIKNDQQLVTNGPYAVVRHPAYTGNLLIGMGTALCHIGAGSWYRECGGLDTSFGKIFAVAWVAWAILKPVLLVSRVKKEDQVLQEEFAEEWERYAQKTPYRLIPFIY